MARPSTLPVHPRELIVAALKQHKQPMTAYELLEALKPQGIKGPPIIYRALEQLMHSGLVHKIKELGSYIACNCGKSHKHALSLLTVCEGCHKVTELHDHAVLHQFEALRAHGIRLTENAVIELPVTCEKCS